MWRLLVLDFFTLASAQSVLIVNMTEHLVLVLKFQVFG